MSHECQMIPLCLVGQKYQKISNMSNFIPLYSLYMSKKKKNSRFFHHVFSLKKVLQAMAARWVPCSATWRSCGTSSSSRRPAPCRWRGPRRWRTAERAEIPRVKWKIPRKNHRKIWGKSQKWRFIAGKFRGNSWLIMVNNCWEWLIMVNNGYSNGIFGYLMIYPPV